MAFKITLNNVILNDEPVGLAHFQVAINRLFADKIITIQYPAKLSFWGQGYEILDNLTTEFGYDYLVPIKIEKSCNNLQRFETIINGFICLSDIIFNELTCIAETIVQDNNYSSKINNNKDIKCTLGVDKTKNNNDFTAANDFDLTLFVPDINQYVALTGGGFAHAGVRKAYDLKDAFDNLLRFISDDTIGFKSTWYDNLPTDERIAVIRGKELRLAGGGINPELTFDDLFKTISRVFNLWGFVEVDSVGDLYFRLEQEDLAFDSDNTLFTLSPKEIKKGSFIELIYANVAFGSAVFRKSTDDTYNANSFNGNLVFLDFLSHINEQFHFDNVCNTSANLTLTATNIIYDHNLITLRLIKDVVAADPVYQVDDNDDDVFLIQYDNTTNTAVETDVLGNLPGGTQDTKFYNAIFLSNAIGLRYNLQGNIAKFLNNGGDLFLAEKNSIQTLIIPSGSIAITELNRISFEDDSTPPNFDTNDRYRASVLAPGAWPVFTYRPQLSGIYTFSYELFFRYTDNQGNPCGGSVVKLETKVRRYDSSGTLKDESAVTSGLYAFDNPAPDPLYSLSQTGSMYVNSSDYIQVDVRAIPGAPLLACPGTREFAFQPTSTFSCITVSNSGGIYDEADENSYFVKKMSFNKNISNENLKLLLNNPQNNIILANTRKGNIKCWANSIVANIGEGEESGETEWELITNIDNIQQ